MSKMTSMETGWNDVEIDVDNVPPDLMPAIMTNRRELLGNAARDMNAKEVAGVLGVLGAYMEANQLLRRHCELVAQRAENVAGAIDGLTVNLNTLKRFAHFDETEGE